MTSRAAARPAVLVFDVNETLLDIRVLEPLFARLFGDGRMMREWFGHLSLHAQSITLAGIHVGFDVLAVAALRMTAQIHGIETGESDVEELRSRLREMPAHEDVAEGLERLREAGFRLATLTNSAPEPDGGPLRRAGLERSFEANLSVEAVRRFKPAPETYREAARSLGVGMGSMCLVACHVWDTLGAQAAGCSGAWMARPGNALLIADGIPLPEIVAGDVRDLADKARERWG